MAAGYSYKMVGVPGEVSVINPGTSANPSLVFGDPNDLDGMNDGFYATSTPTIGLSINGSSVATWSASGMATGAIATDGAIATSSSILSSSASGGIGYSTGSGGAATQGTDKSTAVTLNTVNGAITMNNAALASDATVSFTVNNTSVGVDDVIIVNHSSAGTAGRYAVFANTVTASAFNITVHNFGGTSLSEAIVLSFAVIKGVAA